MWRKQKYANPRMFRDGHAQPQKQQLLAHLYSGIVLIHSRKCVEKTVLKKNILISRSKILKFRFSRKKFRKISWFLREIFFEPQVQKNKTSLEISKLTGQRLGHPHTWIYSDFPSDPKILELMIFFDFFHLASWFSDLKCPKSWKCPISLSFNWIRLLFYHIVLLISTTNCPTNTSVAFL